MTASHQTGRQPDAPPPGDEWKPIPGFRHYQASHRGQIRSVDRTIGGKFYPSVVLKPRPQNSGYLIVTLTGDDGRKQTRTVHSLVLLAHDRPAGPGEETLHGPGGQTDNRWPENLRWGTRPENLADMAAARPPKPPRPRTPCLNHDRCGGYITHGGRRCHECVVELGVAAAVLLEEGERLDKAAERLGYPSHAGLHALAVKYGGYGVRPTPLLRRVADWWRRWTSAGDTE